jgi:hypothetical protein
MLLFNQFWPLKLILEWSNVPAFTTYGPIEANASPFEPHLFPKIILTVAESVDLTFLAFTSEVQTPDE